MPPKILPKLTSQDIEDFHKALDEHEQVASDDVPIPDIEGWDVDQLLPTEHSHKVPANVKERVYPEPPMPSQEEDTSPITDSSDLETPDDEQFDLKKVSPNFFHYKQLKKKQNNYRYRLKREETKGNSSRVLRLQRQLAEIENDIKTFDKNLKKDPFKVATRNIRKNITNSTCKLWSDKTQKWVELHNSLKNHPLKLDIAQDKNNVRTLKFSIRHNPRQYDTPFYHKKLKDQEQKIEENIQRIKKMSDEIEKGQLIPQNSPPTSEQTEPSTPPRDENPTKLFTDEDLPTMIDKYLKK